jgi:hypothetical protein
MMDVISWLTENWMLVAGTAGTVVMGASVAVAAIAPLTKTDKDDKAAAWLKKVYTWLYKVSLNTPNAAEEEENK